MKSYQILYLTNTCELRAAAAEWDDLWWRSEVTLPTTRAELLAQWLEQFASSNEFRALVVEENGRWLAALPMISKRLAKFLPAGTLTSNPWLPCGDLLLDPLADTNNVLLALISAAAELPWPVLWLNDAVIDAPRWRALGEVCREGKVPLVEHARFEVAKIEMAKDWETFTKHLSRSQRSNTSRSLRKLQTLGDLQLKMESSLSPDEVHAWLEKVFTVEDSSWKGASGSSVLRSPGMSDFFLRQARQLAEWGQLEIATLELDRRPIASLFGFGAKGVYHAHKIGYDPRFGQYSPGQVMFWMILEQLHVQGGWNAFDCIGPMTEGLSRWRPSTYTIGRMAIAPRKLLGRLALQAYGCLKPRVRTFKKSAKIKEVREPQSSPSSETYSDSRAIGGFFEPREVQNAFSMVNVRSSC